MDVYFVNPTQFAKHVSPATLCRMDLASLSLVEQFLSYSASHIKFKLMETALIVLHIAWDTHLTELVDNAKMGQF